MSATEAVPSDRPLEVDDWSTTEERRYADLQFQTADHYDVEIESRAVETDDAGRIHYLEAGPEDGEPVLLLHGLSATAATWIPIFPALADDYRLIVPDRPGRGLSSKPSYHGRDLRPFFSTYLVELLDDLGIDRPHVVGNSLGGLQAFFLAVDHDRVDKLCLIGGPGGLTREFPLVWRLITVKGLNRVLYWLMTRGDAVENARERLDEFGVVDDSAIPDVYYELWAANVEIPGNLESLRSFADEAGSFTRMHPMYDISDEIVEIKRPTCFIWGTEDSFFEPEVGQPIAQRMPDAQFHVLDNKGHIPWLEPDDEAETILQEFLDEE